MSDEAELISLFADLTPTPKAYSDPITTPLSECFRFEIDAQVRATFPSFTTPMRFYVVAFRSVRAPHADAKLLYSFDSAAHLEALGSGGLLKYWYGTLNARRECLAMCIWSSREQAVKAGTRPAHIQAASTASSMYESYTLERYWLEISPDWGLTLKPFTKGRTE